LQDITLRDELDQQLTYLDIERTRFPDRLHVEVQVPDDLKEARVPGFILQPLIEIAVKHVVALSAEVTTITIGARAASGRLILSVEDNGPHLGATNAEPRGVGLRNTAERLAARFGSEHKFHAGLVEPRGFRVELEMPLRTTPA
jgi:LytS/YehU family sensor histidine kinase